jgi:hypothetical protein
MLPTRDWMARNFDAFNAKYFNNKLQTPKFDPFYGQRGNLGFYSPDGTVNKLGRIKQINSPGTIHLSGIYDRSEKDLQETLLHEIIHQWVLTIARVYEGKNGHSRQFKAMAERINKDGWDVNETGYVNKYTDEDVEPDNTINDADREDDNTIVNHQTAPPNSHFTKNTYLFVLVDREETAYKVWGFRGELSMAKEYASCCKQFVKSKSACLRIYLCTAKGFARAPLASVEDLQGIGAPTFTILLERLSALTKTSLALYDNVLLQNTITLF